MEASRFSCLLALPDDLLQLVILELPSGSDVKALCRACAALHALVVNGGLGLAAAWLWRRHGNEALFMAMRRKDVAMLRQLIHVHHADVNYTSRANFRGILRCALGFGLEVFRFLLTVPGLDVDWQDADGWTALHWAGSYALEQEVQELLKHPSTNVNHVCNRGRGHTALHWAVYDGHPSIAKALLSHPGIDVTIKTGPCSVCGPGRTALEMASARRNKETVALLTAHVEARSRSGQAAK